MRYLLAGAFFVALAVPNLRAQTLKASSGTGTSGSRLVVRHVIGLENVGGQKNGRLSVQSGAMQFDDGKASVKVPAASIDGIFVGTETTQGGGKIGRGVKTAAIAAPYGSGKVLSLLMRTKVDILTVSYRDAGGGLHAAIFALPIGQGTDVRTQLVVAGARPGAAAEAESERK